MLNTVNNIRRDENKNLIIVIITIFIALFILFVLIFYMLTSPLKFLTGFLDENEISILDEVKSEYGYDQYVDDEDYFSLEDNQYDNTDITFQDGETEVVYYNQMDSRWKNTSYGKTGTIGRSGCGPTSLAMVVSTLTSNNVNPVEMCKWSYRNGYYCEGSGSYHSLIPAGAKKFGLKVKGNAKPQEIVDALSNGKIVIAIMGKGHFTKHGHYIVLRGVTEDGEILVADPASVERSNQEWDLSIILSEARKGADAGGPFWIISK
mgnify:CR=1 FL=1